MKDIQGIELGRGGVLSPALPYANRTCPNKSILITEVLVWGLEPKTVTTDAWYSSRKNLKSLKRANTNFR